MEFNTILFVFVLALLGIILYKVLGVAVKVIIFLTAISIAYMLLVKYPII